jgi:hypothetical protein
MQMKYSLSRISCLVCFIVNVAADIVKLYGFNKCKWLEGAGFDNSVPIVYPLIDGEKLPNKIKKTVWIFF